MWEFVDKIVYINLDQRGDRRLHMNDFFIQGQIPSEKILRLPAIYNKHGAIGCSASHIQVITLAIQCGWSRVLIFEDDVDWNNFEENYAKLEELMKTSGWDVCMLGGLYADVDPPRVKTAFCTHAYIVNQHYYQTLLNNFKESYNLLSKSKSAISWVRSTVRMNEHGEYNLDSYWVKLQLKDNWVYIHTLCVQINSYSNITNTVRTPETLKTSYNGQIIINAADTIRTYIENGDI